MLFENIKNPSQRVDFKTAVLTGLGKDQGLFFPEALPKLDSLHLYSLPFVPRSVAIIKALIGDVIDEPTLTNMVRTAFDFPAPVVAVDEQRYVLELFHGPTLAFKDFGARFMAQCMAQFANQQPVHILTATSGDTGAAVAAAFYGLANVKVTILFPKGRISPLQQKLFTTLGGNIETVAIDGKFDDCQDIVKRAFCDEDLTSQVSLNSANSINVARLIAQVCYYFEAVSQIPQAQRSALKISVPSGNFGNLCAGLMAQAMGLGVKGFVAATNANDTVPRFWRSGQWLPHETVATLSNAMDVSAPNNFVRILHMIEKGWIDREIVQTLAIDEEDTQAGVRTLYKKGYLSEPHAAVAYEALRHYLMDDEFGLFLATAHPAKFKESVEQILGEQLLLPEALAIASRKDCLAKELANDYNAVKQLLLTP